MKIFDAHIRSDTRSDDDLKNLHYFETERVVTAAHAPRRFERADDLLAYLAAVAGDEVARLRRFGLTAHAALGVLPSARPRRTHYEVWRELPALLERPEVIALGEVGVWEDTTAHWELFERQARIALEHGPMPLLVSPPFELRITMTYKMMQLLERLGYPPERVLINFLDERLVENVVQSGFVAGIPLGAASNEPRQAARHLADVLDRLGSPARIVLNSGLRQGASDILGVPKTVEALRDLGVEPDAIDALVYRNAARLYDVPHA